MTSPCSHLEISVQQDQNDRQAVMRAQQQKSTFARLITLLLCLSAGLFAQSSALFPFGQSRTQQQSLQSGQYRPCTPADYGDPNADCVPPTGQNAYSNYSNYNDFS